MTAQANSLLVVILIMCIFHGQSLAVLTTGCPLFNKHFHAIYVISIRLTGYSKVTQLTTFENKSKRNMCRTSTFIGHEKFLLIKVIVFLVVL